MAWPTGELPLAHERRCASCLSGNIRPNRRVRRDGIGTQVLYQCGECFEDFWIVLGE